jgi:HD-like signal output (HDOD) protein
LISPHLDARLHPELAYAAGLLHDLGKIVFSPLLERTVGEWAARPRQHDSFLAMEQELLGSNHAEAGAMLAEQWNLPTTLAQAIAFHHAPSLCPEPNRNLALAVHLGDLLAMMCGSGCGLDCLYYQMDPLAQERIQRDSAWREEAIWKLILALNHEFSSVTQETESASI